jgi:hypothetical protein
MHRVDLASIAFKKVVKVDTFFSAFEKLQKSHAGRSLTKAK